MALMCSSAPALSVACPLPGCCGFVCSCRGAVPVLVIIVVSYCGELVNDFKPRRALSWLSLTQLLSQLRAASRPLVRSSSRSHPPARERAPAHRSRPTEESPVVEENYV